MKYIFSLLLCTALSAMLLASCGGESASYNNGSDTGVSRTDNDVMDNIERGIEDMTDGTVFDANGRHSNVDEYAGNGTDTNVGTGGTGGQGTDMSYSGASISDSNMNN